MILQSPRYKDIYSIRIQFMVRSEKLTYSRLFLVRQ